MTYIDPRKSALKAGLQQLTDAELNVLLRHLYEGRRVLLDRDAHGRANYSDGAYCPLAIATGLHRLKWPGDEESRDERVREVLESEWGLTINNTRGVAGEFYTTERRRDIAAAAMEVLEERGA